MTRTAFIMAASLTALGAAAHAQSLGDKPAKVAVPGVVFTRSLNQAAEGASVADGVLTLASEAKRDNFNDPDGKLSNNTAPVLLTKVDNRKPFTLSGRVSPELLSTYDAGAFYIWVKPDLWLKMAVELDERHKARLVSVRTTGTSDDNNHDVVDARDVHLKISSDTRTVGFYYSIDGESWQLIRLFKNAYPPEIWLGVSAQSPTGKGNTVRFADMKLEQTSISDFRLGR